VEWMGFVGLERGSNEGKYARPALLCIYLDFDDTIMKSSRSRVARSPLLTRLREGGVGEKGPRRPLMGPPGSDPDLQVPGRYDG